MIQPLLWNVLSQHFFPRNKSQEITVFLVGGSRTYEVATNVLIYEGAETRVMLKDDSGSVISFDAVGSLTNGVTLEKKRNLVVFKGVKQSTLIKCRARIKGVWTLFNVRFN